jgi:hypothetical protein
MGARRLFRLGLTLQMLLVRRARRLVLSAIDDFHEDAWLGAGISREALRRDVLAYFKELEANATCRHSVVHPRDARVATWQKRRRDTAGKVRSA